MDAAGAARRDSRADSCALLLELATLEKVLHYHHVSSEPFALLCIVSMLMQPHLLPFVSYILLLLSSRRIAEVC